MLNKIKEGLQKYDCIILEHKDGVGIHSSIKGYPNPENYILVQNFGDCFKIYDVSRNDKYLRVQDTSEDFIICCIILLCKNCRGENFNETFVRKELRNFANKKQFDKVCEFISNKVDTQYFVINKEDFAKVSMIIKEDVASIKYQNIYISKDDPLRIAYVVLYNYAKKLMEFNLEFQTLSLKYDIKDKYDELARLYLFGQTMGPYYFP